MPRGELGVGVFLPTLIVLQIVSVQCFYYLAMGTVWGVCHIVFGYPMSLDHFFTDKHINFVTISGWLESFNTMACAVSGAYLLSLIVERSKKCVDFTFTVFFIHIVSCTFYYQFPLVWEWWLIQVVSSVLMATIGEYWCSIQELKDIPAVSLNR